MNELELAMFEEQELGTEERSADQIANAINQIKAEVQEAVVTGAIRIGRELQAAKSKVPYGEWESWLKTHVDYSPRMAQNLMRIADEYGRMRSDAMKGLSITQATALLGLTAEQKEAFVEEHAGEGLTTDEWSKEVKRLKEQLAGQQQTITDLMAERDALREGAVCVPGEDFGQIEELEKMLEEAKAKAAAAEAKAAEVEKSAAYRLEMNANAVKDAIEAKEAAAKARQEKAQLETQLQAYKQRAEVAERQQARVEEQLMAEREKPAQVEYRTSPETEQELAQLRAAAGRGEDEIVLREQIGELGRVLDKISGRIARIRMQDAERAGKLSATVAQLLGKRAEAMRLGKAESLSRAEEAGNRRP